MEGNTKFAQFVIHHEARRNASRVYDCCQVNPSIATPILEEVRIHASLLIGLEIPTTGLVVAIENNPERVPTYSSMH